MSEYCVCIKCGALADNTQLNSQCEFCDGLYLDVECVEVEEVYVENDFQGFLIPEEDWKPKAT